MSEETFLSNVSTRWNSQAVQGIQFVRAVKPFVREPRRFEFTTESFYPLIVTFSWPEIIDDIPLLTKNIILFACFATLIVDSFSAIFSTEYSLSTLRSYFPELKPKTGTWLHQSSIFVRCFLGKYSVSIGMYLVRAINRIASARRSNSANNRRQRFSGFLSQIYVGSGSRLSPIETEIGT